VIDAPPLGPTTLIVCDAGVPPEGPADPALAHAASAIEATERKEAARIIVSKKLESTADPSLGAG
jgi:hypothetical protein